MLEELVETAVGPWGIAAVLLFATQRGRKLARTAFKETVKFGMIAGERVKEAYAEIQEEAADAIAEAQAEHKDNSKHIKMRAHANPKQD
jgi:gas vesicle protein